MNILKNNLFVLLVLFFISTSLIIADDNNVKVVKGKLVAKLNDYNKATLNVVEVETPVLKGRLVSTPYQNDSYHYNDDNGANVAVALGMTALFFGIYAHNSHYSYSYHSRHHYTPYYTNRYNYRHYYSPYYYKNYNRGHHDRYYNERHHSRDYSRRRR